MKTAVRKLQSPWLAFGGAITLIVNVACLGSAENTSTAMHPESNITAEEFAEYENRDFTLRFEDAGTGDWRENWVVDGRKAEIENTPEGMVFSAGPNPKENESHAVLWTKQSFSGDMKVEFEYTRMDSATRFVNILYMQAEGVGGDYTKDIHTWADQREVAYMSTYFNHMDLLHISYAAFGSQEEPRKNYIRVRRYPVTEERSFEQIEVEPTIWNTDFFAPGVVHQMCFIKTEEKLALRVSNEESTLYYLWDLSKVDPTGQGPLGIRHMKTRSSRYKNIKVSTNADDKKK